MTNITDDDENRGSPEGRSRSAVRYRSESARPDYRMDTDGLDVKEEEDEDEEYQEDEDLEDEARLPTEGTTPVVSRRGRPAKRRRREGTHDDNRSETEGSRSGSAIPGGFGTKRPRFSHPVDDAGVPLPVINEEYDLPDDTEGETKINRNGDLLGDRQFLVRTFTLSDKGQRKFMLSTEPARAVGFRDSYLFFQYHPNLYKFILSQEQKNDLIDRGVLPYSYRSRQIALVTARSVFKEFGAKILIGGKNITDDYYATKLREEGRLVEGTYAREPPKKTNNRGLDSLDYADSTGAINPAKNAVEFFDRRYQGHANGATSTATASKMTATNWLYQHAAACSRLNSDMYYDRVRVLLIEQQGLRDPYTNTLHIPQSTQSSTVLDHCKWSLTNEDLSNDYSIIYETIIKDDDLTRNKTGLSDVPMEIFDGFVSEEVKSAILEQQRFETES